ncbi:TraR/DksA C4-type zinc finger protein [Cytobacillus gottheilii]|uniref:TraR/DksA C4-type zinc finger protein n=1 Tax=Cytobacillus gottheilii TaxID=859144 RepID=A0ABX8FB79_9BACI|nr:TraR/DksA C4-type zinc finger protein [Cytobacillus gottheilii]QVY60812.1 TraR/DksA C4-type zinc finger protein [Cytobacillus gottheilii]
MLTNTQLDQLKSTLLEEKQSLENQLQDNKDGSLEGVNARETVGELSLYDNHPADMGSELYEREKDFALEEHHDSQVNKINVALQAIENGTYGKCKECGTEIPFERLEVVPYTLYCKEHSPEQSIKGDRPVEEEVLEPAHGNTFQHKQFREVVDNEDSFQEVARYGTSETPSDLRGDYEDYNSLYNEGHDDEGFTEDYETFIGNDMEGKSRKIYPSKKHEEYEAMLDSEDIDAPFGDVPYHQSDGYVDDKKDE